MQGKRPATYQDVLDAPEHMVAELIDGVLFLSPRPKPPQAAVKMLVGCEVITPFVFGERGPGGWIVVKEPELRLGEDVLVPDLAGWRITRLPEIPDDFTIAPDWVCEIASKSTERLDRKKKLPTYAAAGVGHAWMIHPAHRSLQVLRRLDKHWLEVGYYLDDERVRAEPFDAVEIDLARLWRGQPLRVSESSEYALDY